MSANKYQHGGQHSARNISISHGQQSKSPVMLVKQQPSISSKILNSPYAAAINERPSNVVGTTRIQRSYSPDQLAQLRVSSQLFHNVIQQNLQVQLSGRKEVTARHVSSISPLKASYNIPQPLKRQIQQSANNLIDTSNKNINSFIQGHNQQYQNDHIIMEEHDDTQTKDQVIYKYRNKIKKLKNDNKQLFQMIQQSDQALTQKIVEVRSEQDQAMLYQRAIVNQLVKLKVIQDTRIDDCKSFKDLLNTIDSLLQKGSAPTKFFQNQVSNTFPPVDSYHNNQSQITSYTEQMQLKQENDQLRQQIARLENQINHIERDFKLYLCEGYKMNGELTELKALKKSIQQYFTSQNCQSWKSTAIQDLKYSNSQNKEVEEPSPSFLRIMVTEQIIEEDQKGDSLNIQSTNLSPVEHLKIPNNKTPSPVKTMFFLNQNYKVSIFDKARTDHSIEQSFSLPEISSNFGENSNRKSSCQNSSQLNNVLNKVQHLNRNNQNLTLQQLLAQEKSINSNELNISERIQRNKSANNINVSEGYE